MRIEKEFPAAAPIVAMSRFRFGLAAGRFDAAYAFGRELFDAATARGDVDRLLQIAWAIVDPTAEVATRDLALARDAAEKAHALTKGEDPVALDTLARVRFAQGDASAAAELQKRALARAHEHHRPRLREALREYETAAD